MHILIADDEEGIRGVLSAFFEEEGFTVLEAQTGADAIELLRAQPADQPIDLVILDLGLPDMTGYKVLREIRNKSREMPVVLLSGNFDQFASQMPDGDPHVLKVEKPISPGVLVECAKALLATRT